MGLLDKATKPFKKVFKKVKKVVKKVMKNKIVRAVVMAAAIYFTAGAAAGAMSAYGAGTSVWAGAGQGIASSWGALSSGFASGGISGALSSAGSNFAANAGTITGLGSTAPAGAAAPGATSSTAAASPVASGSTANALGQSTTKVMADGSIQTVLPNGSVAMQSGMTQGSTELVRDAAGKEMLKEVGKEGVAAGMTTSEKVLAGGALVSGGSQGYGMYAQNKAEEDAQKAQEDQYNDAFDGISGNSGVLSSMQPGYNVGEGTSYKPVTTMEDVVKLQQQGQLNYMPQSMYSQRYS